MSQNFDGFGLFKALSYLLISSSAHSLRPPAQILLSILQRLVSVIVALFCLRKIPQTISLGISKETAKTLKTIMQDNITL